MSGINVAIFCGIWFFVIIMVVGLYDIWFKKGVPDIELDENEELDENLDDTVILDDDTVILEPKEEEFNIEQD